MKIEFFSNGNVLAFENGRQSPKVQYPWLILFAEYLEECDVDPTQCEFVMPNGWVAKIGRNDDGSFNWELQQGQTPASRETYDRFWSENRQRHI